jgi:lysophospholipase L1-like esterase
MVSATPIKYAAGDITATNAFSSTVANLLINFNGFGISPYLAVTGDSISAGFYDWQGHEDAGPVGTITSDPWYQMRQLVNGAQLNGFEYQNFGKGAQSYSWVVSTGLPDALASGAKVILIHCGVNDINTSRTWAQVEANLDSIKTLYAASSSAELLVFDEILPWTNGTDGQADTVRLWNANLATWITANTTGPKPIKLCLCHDAMGKIRVSTGFLDDLQTTPDYDSDGVHPTALGYGQLASLALPYIKI